MPFKSLAISLTFEKKFFRKYMHVFEMLVRSGKIRESTPCSPINIYPYTLHFLTKVNCWTNSYN